MTEETAQRIASALERLASAAELQAGVLRGSEAQFGPMETKEIIHRFNRIQESNSGVQPGAVQ